MSLFPSFHLKNECSKFKKKCKKVLELNQLSKWECKKYLVKET